MVIRLQASLSAIHVASRASDRVAKGNPVSSNGSRARHLTSEYAEIPRQGRHLADEDR